MKKPGKRKITAIVLLVVAALLAVAALVLPRTLTVMIYNDNFGKRFTTYDPMTWSIDDFDGLQRERYEFPSDKGQLLTGYRYHRGGEDAKGVVVLAHGFGGGGHRSYMNVADYFASNGYAVFAYDATGNDESQGDAVGGLPQGLIDLDYALRFVKGCPDFAGMPIFLWGHSWGGYAAGAVLQLHPDVKAAVIVAGFNESTDMLAAEGRNIVGDVIDLALPLLERYEAELFGDYAAMSVLDGLACTRARVMIIHSADDGMIPIEMSFDRYHEAFAEDPRFVFVRYEDRGHNYVFCAEERLAYIETYNAGADAYKAQVGTMTEEMRAAYYREHLDKHRAYQLDEALMGQMLDMFDSCL